MQLWRVRWRALILLGSAGFAATAWADPGVPVSLWERIEGIVHAIATYIEPVAGFLNLLLIALSVIVASVLVIVTSRSMRRRSSIEHIVHQTRDRDLIKMFEQARALNLHLEAIGQDAQTLSHNRATELELAEGIAGRTAKSADDILKKVFNYYEATAIGIHNRALDRQIVKAWWRNSFVWYWYEYEHYILTARESLSDPDLYSQYEMLAKRWRERRDHWRLRRGVWGVVWQKLWPWGRTQSAQS